MDFDMFKNGSVDRGIFQTCTEVQYVCIAEITRMILVRKYLSVL